MGAGLVTTAVSLLLAYGGTKFLNQVPNMVGQGSLIAPPEQLEIWQKSTIDTLVPTLLNNAKDNIVGGFATGATEDQEYISPSERIRQQQRIYTNARIKETLIDRAVFSTSLVGDAAKALAPLAPALLTSGLNLGAPIVGAIPMIGAPLSMAMRAGGSILKIPGIKQVYNFAKIPLTALTTIGAFISSKRLQMRTNLGIRAYSGNDPTLALSHNGQLLDSFDRERRLGEESLKVRSLRTPLREDWAIPGLLVPAKIRGAFEGLKMWAKAFGEPGIQLAESAENTFNVFFPPQNNDSPLNSIIA